MYRSRLLLACLIVLLAGLVFSVHVSGQAFSRLSTTGLPALSQAKSVWANFDTTSSKLEVLLTGKTVDGKGFVQAYQLADSATRRFIPFGNELVSLTEVTTAVHDYNHDNLIDLLISGITDNGTPVTKLFANKSRGVFEEVSTPLPGLRKGQVRWVDLDNDGWKDIILNGLTAQDQPLTQIFRYTPSGFVLQTHNLPGMSDGVLLDLQLDNDSRPDLFISGLSASGNPFSALYRNSGNFQFELLSQSIEALYKGSAAAGDFNADGKTDLLLSGLNASDTPVTQLYLQDGETFTPAGFPMPGIYQSSVHLAELTNDGLTDILLAGIEANGNPVAQLLRNGGDGKAYELPAALGNLTTPHFSLVDLTSDGNLEILQTGNAGTNPQIHYLFNLAAKKNLGPMAPTNPQVNKVENQTIFTWSASADDFTAAPVLTYEVYIWSEDSRLYTKTLEISGTDKRRNVVTHGSQGQLTTFTVYDLPEGTYEWGIQSIDNAFETRGKKGICRGGKFTVKPDGVVTEPDPEPVARKEVFIPTLFSPNSDGKNDEFKVYGEGFAELHLRIYDRSGALLFETRDIRTATNNGWDGTNNGRPVPNGTYFWSLSGSYADGTQVQFNSKQSGAINLIR
ncbi:FG-GAP-like repeat-containing protein [Rhodocytophaga aerolata]|uniref:FG-GAP-like repeat-containing protein n=1 Tax=Rhodocytophaga aerolata TaxID=455078 RepID=A0ABT8R7I8_9BACT|nr:FG-GAP-like repeat-containing protein [Rhodocytophaga aerolata]MDO1448070.1 FG-GAP-like repeat-containing protein [Rhodocytophaga aerolata]